MPMNLSLGIGIGHNGGPTFDPDARAWFAAMPTQPTDQVKSILSTFILGLKADGIWPLIDGGNFLCLETLAQGLVDFKNPARVATLAPGFTSTFLTYRGVTGSGSLAASQDAYIDTGFIPSSAGGVMTQDTATIGLYSATAGTGNNVEFGANAAAADLYMVTRNSSDIFLGRPNIITNANMLTGVTDGVGFFALNRTAAALSRGYKNGVVGSDITDASTGFPNVSLRYLQTQSASATTKQLCFGIYGAIPDALQAALNTRAQATVTALRAL